MPESILDVAIMAFFVILTIKVIAVLFWTKVPKDKWMD